MIKQLVTKLREGYSARRMAAKTGVMGSSLPPSSVEKIHLDLSSVDYVASILFARPR